MRWTTAVWIPSILLLGAGVLSATEPVNGTYIATAYAQHIDLTASGLRVHRHVVAADPDILPIGSRIKIRHAGRYSGEYVVADTGDKIQGRRLDIYMPNVRVCKKFGSKPVRVKVIELGDGTHAAAKEADKIVKQDVAQDVAKKVVGNAATEADWAAKGRVPASSTTATSTAASKSTVTAPASSTKNPQ
jgi:3D (Asp-Asp-Asp) domain-containing protein